MRKIRADPNIGDPATALTQLLPDDVPEEAKDLLLELIADDLDSAEERLTPSPPPEVRRHVGRVGSSGACAVCIEPCRV